ncbi:hypothetical protein YC2023_005213 [Brassica napus]
MMSRSKPIRAPPFEPVLASQRWIKQKYNSNADGPVEITMTPIIQRRLHIKQPETCRSYCECFAAGVYCIEPCSCIDCFNKPIHEDTVLATRKQIESRNPLAFAPKVIRISDSIMETSDDASKTRASAPHKRGCNCKKSNLSQEILCEGCKNAFGRKDAYLHAIMESKQEEDHETYEKRTANIQEIEQNPSSDQPSTPLPPYRLPRTQFFLGADSDLTQSKNEKKPVETVTEEKPEIMPEILSNTLITTIKAISPNSQRVSPPQLGSSESGSILVKRSNGRKLILRSIPAFPFLNPHQ